MQGEQCNSPANASNVIIHQTLHAGKERSLPLDGTGHERIKPRLGRKCRCAQCNLIHGDHQTLCTGRRAIWFSLTNDGTSIKPCVQGGKIVTSLFYFHRVHQTQTWEERTNRCSLHSAGMHQILCTGKKATLAVLAPLRICIKPRTRGRKLQRIKPKLGIRGWSTGALMHIKPCMREKRVRKSLQ